jgi:hypothetical protein
MRFTQIFPQLPARHIDPDHYQSGQTAYPVETRCKGRGGYPPLECCFRTSPIQTERLRPDLNIVRTLGQR